MIKVAVTGGIGCGKSFICQMLEHRGIHVYDCDKAAKRIMSLSREVQSRLVDVVGKNVIVDGRVNKPVLAEYLLKNESNAQRINQIVHPAVAEDFVSSGYSWMECALLFSSGFNKLVDKVICVTAPLDVRIDRIMQRDGISREKAWEWIECQMPQDEVKALSDYEIVNDESEDLDMQISSILASLESIDAIK